MACVFLFTVAELREKRVTRYDSLQAASAFAAARDDCLGAGALLGALALLPIVVAIA